MSIASVFLFFISFMYVVNFLQCIYADSINLYTYKSYIK